MPSDPRVIEETFANVFNHVAVKRGWRTLPFTLDEMALVFAMAAVAVGKCRQKQKRNSNNSFTLTKIGGCSWDYLFSITAKDMVSLKNETGNEQTKLMVEELTKHTLRDATGFVGGVNEEEIVQEVQRVLHVMCTPAVHV